MSTSSAPARIAGWAQNPDHPEAPVCLEIYAGGRLIGQVLANRYREDLERAGLGSGCHGFEFAPAGWTDLHGGLGRGAPLARRRAHSRAPTLAADFGAHGSGEPLVTRPDPVRTVAEAARAG